MKYLNVSLFIIAFTCQEELAFTPMHVILIFSLAPSSCSEEPSAATKSFIRTAQTLDPLVFFGHTDVTYYYFTASKITKAITEKNQTPKPSDPSSLSFRD